VTRPAAGPPEPAAPPAPARATYADQLAAYERRRRAADDVLIERMAPVRPIAT